MRHWYDIFPRHTGLSLYIWMIFCVLPFYFIFRSTSLFEIVIGSVVTLLFFGVYWVTFTSRGPLVYIGLSVEYVIHIIMTLLYGYVYFALFSAFFVGNIRHKAGFITMYVIHLVVTAGAMTAGFIIKYSLFLEQIPFLIMTILGVILIPINRYNRIKQEELEGQLEDANRKIAELAIMEERHRIARDLHDTLGQKLSMIGLKSELSAKLMERNQEAAKQELKDVQDTARQALKEVREMVSNMKSIRIEDEIDHAKQLLKLAGIDCEVKVEADIGHFPILIENVISMCLKESVTNIVKHSNASRCFIHLRETDDSTHLQVLDNGMGTVDKNKFGNGLTGMKERLEFVNGTLRIHSSSEGFEVLVSVPKVLKQVEKEGDV
ncbi:sensor histidine kinase [Gracilibacillus caseinilyticus]|uniref:histidine kinase n=1 Tax=Gracilibacillus caseinilyticus TaxID=2932256 RepID=A0ABY4EZZ7_9BACI|nr:sensor histidine kinase [Gracilibacillus caseinilyticus]UOQ49229.1 sensor histidine kinase [Gracilibacillus caseinilyticus]